MKDIILIEHEKVKIRLALNEFEDTRTHTIKRTLDIRYLCRDHLSPDKWLFTKKGVGLNKTAAIKLINSLQDPDIIAKIMKHFEKDSE